MEKYRHELKYLIDQGQMLLIRQRLEKTMRLDEHVKGGSYLISSLYFDDYDDSCFHDVGAGVDLRKKYRMRYYDHDDSRISLECKAKRQNLMLKRSTLLNKEESRALVKGRYLRDISAQDEMKKEFTGKMMAQGYHPVIIVEYERIPYVYKAGNVRITFDMNVRSSKDIENFLGDYKRLRPVLPHGSLIMEVKYDEYLPNVIYDCLNTGDLEQLSISKYTLCRRFITTAEELI